MLREIYKGNAVHTTNLNSSLNTFKARLVWFLTTCVQIFKLDAISLQLLSSMYASSNIFRQAGALIFCSAW